MKKLKCLIFLLIIINISCKQNTSSSKEEVAKTHQKSDIQTEEIQYDIDGIAYKTFVAYPKDQNSPKPVVMVIPEWWGLNDYAKSRAKQLAELGYFSMAIDIYGNGKSVETPQEAHELSSHFYKIPINAKLVFDKAKAQILKFDQADYSKIAVIGYCFGGAQALNMARQESDLKAVVSFHGNLMTGIKPKNNKVKILVCNGAADSFVGQDEINAFKTQMDSAKIQYTFIDYPDAKHSFTNPASTEIGQKYQLDVAYNKEADEKSWSDMQQFLTEAFQ